MIPVPIAIGVAPPAELNQEQARNFIKAALHDIISRQSRFNYFDVVEDAFLALDTDTLNNLKAALHMDQQLLTVQALQIYFGMQQAPHAPLADANNARQVILNSIANHSAMWNDIVNEFGDVVIGAPEPDFPHGKRKRSRKHKGKRRYKKKSLRK